MPRFLSDPGVEIGAFRTPIPCINPIYVDRFAYYAGEPTLAEYYGDACNLPFEDSALNYVATSHVIEHVANPLAALKEWYRVLRHEGIVYAVVPDRRKTFDHLRPLTTVDHLIDDFRAGTTQCDGTHIDEFALQVDWSRFSPGTPRNEAGAARASLLDCYRSAIALNKEVNIHFHTFEPDSFVELISAANRLPLWLGSMEVKLVRESFPASNPLGFLIVAQVSKPVAERSRTGGDGSGLRADARPPDLG